MRKESFKKRKAKRFGERVRGPKRNEEKAGKRSMKGRKKKIPETVGGPERNEEEKGRTKIK